MARRMIDASLWQSESFAELPMAARLLQIGMINLADDQGRIKAHPAHLRAQIFPYDDISNTEIQSWLELIERNETIILYTVGGKQFAQLTKWWKYQSLQYAQPSQFPRPAGWSDRIRKTVTKGFIATCNWLTTDGTRLDDTCDEDGNPLSITAKQDSKTPQKSPESSGELSPNHSPESSPEGTNRTKDKYKLTTTTPAREEVQVNGSGGSGSADLPTNRNRQADSEYAEICTAVEKNGYGTLTQLMADEINALLNEYPAPWILDAMRIGVEANKRQIRYVRGILSKWRADGRDSPPKPLPQVGGMAVLSQNGSGMVVQGDISKMYRS